MKREKENKMTNKQENSKYGFCFGISWMPFYDHDCLGQKSSHPQGTLWLGESTWQIDGRKTLSEIFRAGPSKDVSFPPSTKQCLELTDLTTVCTVRFPTHVRPRVLGKEASFDGAANAPQGNQSSPNWSLQSVSKNRGACSPLLHTPEPGLEFLFSTFWPFS